MLLAAPDPGPPVPQRGDRVASVTGRYADLVRRYVSEGPSQPSLELAAWSDEDVALAVGRLTSLIAEAERLFRELAELEVKMKAHFGADFASFELQRGRKTERLERVYEALHTGEISPEWERREGTHRAMPGAREAQAALASEAWRDGFPESLARYVRGAIGLHTAMAAADWDKGLSLGVVVQLAMARVHVRKVLVPFDPGYGSLWCGIGGTLLTASDRHGEAMQHLDECLTWYPDDGSLRLARGSSSEALALLLERLPPMSRLAGWNERPRDASSRAARAIADFEAAMQRSPDLVEARLRLARLRLHTGDADQAATLLAPLRDRSLPRVLQYWLWMFLGAAEERRGNAQIGAGHYRRAMALYPESQAAAIALSRVLAERLDARQEAITELRPRLQPSSSRDFNSDPWWFYRLGQAWRARDWLAELETRSRQ